MSDAIRPLPARASLEQLRKQAKDRVKALRAQGADATLADVQFALAQRVPASGTGRTLSRAALRPSIRPASGRSNRWRKKLATAYSAGDFEAIREFNWTHGTSFVWHRESRSHARATADMVGLRIGGQGISRGTGRPQPDSAGSAIG